VREGLRRPYRRGCRASGRRLFGRADPRARGRAGLATARLQTADGIGYKAAPIARSKSRSSLHLVIVFWSPASSARHISARRSACTGAPDDHRPPRRPRGSAALVVHGRRAGKCVELGGQTECAAFDHQTRSAAPSRVLDRCPCRKTSQLTGRCTPGRSRSVVNGLPQPAKKNAEGRWSDGSAGTRRRRPQSTMRAIFYLTPHEGHHPHGRRQEHHAVRDREPAEVLPYINRSRWRSRPARPT